MPFSNEKIYILHKRGSKSHYLGLMENLNLRKIQYEFYEFSVFTKIYKSILKSDFKLLIKQFKNIVFLINLSLTKDKKIVLAIEPLDKKLNLLLKILRNHKIYYHASWANWEGKFFPRPSNCPKTLSNWSYFLKVKVEHIFTVTLKSKIQILKRYELKESNITVVHHSIHPMSRNIPDITKKKNSYIFHGRLVKQKGISELLKLFSQTTDASITFVGDGPLAELVNSYSLSYTNIHYYPHIEKKHQLMTIVGKHQYFIQYSKKTSNWEELFGISMLEAMWLGLIVISTNHSGPREILGCDYVYLFSEENFVEGLKDIIQTNIVNKELIGKLQSKADSYNIKKIAPLWNLIHN